MRDPHRWIQVHLYRTQLPQSALNTFRIIHILSFWVIRIRRLTRRALGAVQQAHAAWVASDEIVHKRKAC